MVIDRAEIVAMLAAMSGRSAGVAAETIDSLELVWLLHQVETKTNTRLDLDDDDLDRMGTVDGAVAVLNEALAATADPAVDTASSTGRHG